MFDSVTFMVQTGSAALAAVIGIKAATKARIVEATTFRGFFINKLRSHIVPVYWGGLLEAIHNLAIS